MRFYEKVIKVKADVAARLIFSPMLRQAPRDVESCQGRLFWAFILTLDSSPRPFIIERGTKRKAVQWSFVLSGGVSLWGIQPSPSKIVSPISTPPLLSNVFADCGRQNINCFARLFPSFQKSWPAPPTIAPASIRTLNGPLLGPVHLGVRFKAQVHHHGDGPGLLGAAI